MSDASDIPRERPEKLRPLDDVVSATVNGGGVLPVDWTLLRSPIDPLHSLVGSTKRT